ncbi:MAG: precorrin-8X methylmutase [Pseudomonadota bacterium]|nr:precorrin-8X methylmutase [Pseudomonadota bacterium]
MSRPGADPAPADAPADPTVGGASPGRASGRAPDLAPDRVEGRASAPVSGTDPVASPAALPDDPPAASPIAFRPLFDAVIAVDWSAAARPALGADSIWLALARRDGTEPPAPENLPTRAAARERLADLLSGLLDEGRRVLVGFDFPFGLPEGAAAALFGAPGWRAAWAGIEAGLSDAPDNANDRFALAARLNCRGGAFWGHPRGPARPDLPATRPAAFPLPEHRRAETAAFATGARPKTVWQLNGAGSVGGQALTGIASLARLRADPRLAGRVSVWPFETGFDPAPPAPGHAVLAEIYPSLLPPHPAEAVKDAGQVRAVAGALAALDRKGRLAPLLAAPAGLSAPDLAAVAEEEGWILGLGHAPALRRAAAMDYERDPARIYAKSFATVRAEARLDRFPPDLAELAVRVIHACGQVEAADGLAASPDVVAAGRAALAAGAPVICDAAMVAQGIIRRGLPAGVEVLTAIADPGCAARATAIANTRSAAAMDLIAPRLGGAVVAIGNAPTALFRLLELIDDGAPRPAAILGFPVGFVGAAESKAALAADPRGIPFATLNGRMGGSAIAAAAVNALTLGLAGDGLAPPREGGR